MDDYYFQHELQRLQHRFSALSPRQHPEQAGRGLTVASSDAFLDQVADLKAHIDQLQAASLAHLNEPRWRSGTSAPMTCHARVAAVGSSPLAVTHNTFTLPSGPLFWQLFNSLRTDVRSIDTRVTGLEQSISDLEDRVDGWDPACFTPPGSIASGDGPLQMPRPSGGSFGPMPVPDVLELDSDVADPPKLAISSHTMQNPDAGGSRGVLHPSYCASSPYECNGGPELGHDQRKEIIDTQHAAAPALTAVVTSKLPLSDVPEQTTAASGPALPAIGSEGVAFRDREIARMDEQLRTVQERLKLSEEAVAQKDRMATEWMAERQGMKARIVDISEVKGQLERQLEERDVQLRQWEDSWVRMEKAYRYAVDEKENAVRQNTNRQMPYIEHLNAARAEIVKLRISVNDTRNAYNETKDSLIAQREDMAKLQRFCESKDVVIRQQEQIISRGALLLQERDREIEVSGKTIKSAEDDKEHIIREQLRTARLLEEAKQEVLRWKTGAMTARSTSSDGCRTEVASQTRGRPVFDLSPAAAQAREEVLAQPLLNEIERDHLDDGFRRHCRKSQPTIGSEDADRDRADRPRQVHSSHEPKERHTRDEEPTQSDRRSSEGRTHVPVEGEERALRWAREYIQGGLSSISEARGPTQDRGVAHERGGQNREGRPPSRLPYRHYMRRSSPSFRGSPRTLQPPRDQDAAGWEWHSPRRRSRLEDDASLRPPLPMPVAARKRASETDLRHSCVRQPAARAATGPGMSKHQSMQDLGRRWLQAYVETESESGAEGRGV